MSLPLARRSDLGYVHERSQHSARADAQKGFWGLGWVPQRVVVTSALANCLAGFSARPTTQLPLAATSLPFFDRHPTPNPLSHLIAKR